MTDNGKGSLRTPGCKRQSGRLADSPSLVVISDDNSGPGAWSQSPTRKVITLVEIGEESGVGRLPTENLSGDLIGGGEVKGDQKREKPEMLLYPIG